MQWQSTFAATETNPDFSYQTFATCSDFENTLKQILPTTYNDGRMYKWVMLAESSSIGAVAPTASRMADSSNTPKSETNVQVKWIDEADTVKTDGKYLYSYQEWEKAIVVLDAKTLIKIKTLRIMQLF